MADLDENLIYLSDMDGRNLYSSLALYAFTGREPGSASGFGWHHRSMVADPQA